MPSETDLSNQVQHRVLQNLKNGFFALAGQTMVLKRVRFTPWRTRNASWQAIASSSAALDLKCLYARK
jgi:hypothetical protein